MPKKKQEKSEETFANVAITKSVSVVNESELEPSILFDDILTSIDHYSDVLSSKLELADFIKNLYQEEIIDLVDNMRFDDDIATALKNLKAELKNISYEILPFDDSSKSQKDMEFVKEQFEKHFNKLIDSYFESYVYGYSVSYFKWKISKGKWIVDKIEDLGASPFGFTPEGNLYLHDDLYIGGKPYPSGTMINMQSEIARLKLMLSIHGKVGNNWYGTPEVLLCYYLWTFKNLSAQQWALFLKKVVIPSFVALFDATENAEDTKIKAAALAEALRKIKNGTGAAMANVNSIERLDPGVGANDSFPEMINLMSRKIHRVLTGAFLTSDTSENGSYTTSTIHKQTTQLLALSLMEEFAKIIEDSFFYSLVALNQPRGTEVNQPKLYVYIKNIADWEKIRDCLSFGIPLKKESLKQDYSIPIADAEDKEDDIIKIEKVQTQQNFSDFFFQSKET